MRANKKIYRKKTAVKAMVTAVVLVLILWSACGIKANAAEKADNDKMEYQMRENDFVKQIRECMEEMGYCNSGITLTKVMDTDGSREYNVMVHHSDIDLENTEEIKKVYGLLDGITFSEENVMVNYRIF